MRIEFKTLLIRVTCLSMALFHLGCIGSDLLLSSSISAQSSSSAEKPCSSPPKATHVRFDGASMKIEGTCLKNVTKISIDGNSTEFGISAQSDSSISAYAQSTMKLIASGVYYLLLESAQADDTKVSISFVIGDNSVESKHLANMSATDNQVLTYLSGQGWQPKSLGAAASLNVGTSAGTVASGDHTHTESDPKVGTLQQEKWCKASQDGKIECTHDAPAAESTPTYGSIVVLYNSNDMANNRDSLPWSASEVLAAQNKSYHWVAGPPSLQDTAYCKNGANAGHKVHSATGQGRYSVTFGKYSGNAAIFGSYHGTHLSVYDTSSSWQLISGSSQSSTGWVNFVLVYFSGRWVLFSMTGQTDSTLFSCRYPG